MKKLSERINGEVWKDPFNPKTPWRCMVYRVPCEFRTKKDALACADEIRKNEIKR